MRTQRRTRRPFTIPTSTSATARPGTTSATSGRSSPSPGRRRYYDQFYVPFRSYDRPIFAIAGNHDGAVYGPDVDVPVAPTLQAFLRNFCVNAPGPSPAAVGISRTTMDPVSFDATHGSSRAMAQRDRSRVRTGGVWPDIVLSGHTHLYQRFSRSVGGRSIPYVVAGSGGHLTRRSRPA